MAAKGFTANQTIAAMPGIIAAAEASGEDLALAADTVSTALNIFGLEASESSRVADILTVTANESAAGITDMQYALKYAGAPAAALGISLEELSASIGLVVDSGIDGSSAGTALRASLLALNNPAKAQAKIMKELGFSLTDSEGKTKGMADMIRDMTEATKHMTEAEKVATLAKLVGTEAVSGFLTLMKAGPEAIEANTKALENSAGASAAASAEMKAGIGGALENLTGAIETLAIKIGYQLVPYIQIAAEWLASLAEKFSGLSERTMKFLVVGTALTGVFTAIGAGIGILIMGVGSVISAFATITGVMATIATSLGITGGATGLLGAAFAALTGPIAIAVAAVAGIIAALVVAYKKVWWFNEGVNDAWTAIKEGTVKAFNAVKSAITTAVQAVLDFVKPQLDKFRDFWDENGKAITILAKSYFVYLQTMIKGIMGVIQGIFQTVWPIIANTVKTTWETIKLVVSTAINLVLGVIQTVLKVLQGDWQGAWTTIKDTLKTIWGDIGKFLKGISLEETGKDIIRGLINGIKAMGGAVIDAVKGVVGNVAKTVKSMLDINSPSRVMETYGEFTGIGFANGIANTTGAVKKVAESLAGIPKLAMQAADPIEKSSPRTKKRASKLKGILLSMKAPKIQINEVFA